MINRKLMTLALASALSLSIMAAPVFAADTDSISSTAAGEIQESQDALENQQDQDVIEGQQDQDTQKNQKNKDTQTDQQGQDVQADQSAGGNKKGGHHSKKAPEQEAAEPEGAIGKDAAKAKALEDAGVSADKVGRIMAFAAQLEDGTVVYKVRFTCDGTRYSYRINALTGDVVEKNSAAADTTGRKGGKKDPREEIAEPDGAIGKDAAKAKALEDAGVSADKVSRIMAFAAQLEDGTVVYKVRFSCDGTRYSYRINALTGEIVEKKTGDASERPAGKNRSKTSDGDTAPENSDSTAADTVLDA